MTPGQPASAPPGNLLKLYILGFAYGVRNSRGVLKLQPSALPGDVNALSGLRTSRDVYLTTQEAAGLTMSVA